MRRFTVVIRLLVACALALLIAAGCASRGASAPAAPAAPPPPPAAVGSWNLVVETPIGNQESVLTLTGTADLMEGKIAGAQGETVLRDVVFAGDQLTFAVSIDAQGQAMDLTFEGTVTGDALSGSFTSPFGPAPVTGTRAVN